MTMKAGAYGVAAMLALAGLGLGSAASAQTFRLAHHHAVGGLIDLAANKFAELAEDKSDGRIEIQIFPAAQLGQEREAYDLLNQGAIDLTFTSAGFLAKHFPPFAVTGLPFIFRDWDHARSALRGDFGTELADGARDNSNTEVLSYVGGGFRDMLFRGEPATTVAAMEGLKMRSPEDFVWIRMYELLGARPTPITFGEVYTAMQTGVANGLDMPGLVTIDLKFYEVTDSLVKTGHMFTPLVIAMNKEVFDGLSPEDQDLLRAAAWEAADWADTTISIPGEEAAYAELQELGMTVVEPENIDEWAAAVRPLWDEIAAQAEDNQRFIDMLSASQ